MSTCLAALQTDELPLHLSWIEPRAGDVMTQFFRAELDNERTRRAYKTGAADFFRSIAPHLIGGLASINALHVSDWIADMKARCLAMPTIKQRLAGLRMLFQTLAREQVIRSNPVSVVKGPKHKVERGKTPAIDAAEVERLLSSIKTTTLVGLRDRAVIATMAYTFARISAVTSLSVEHVFHQKQHLWLRLTEKGGKVKDVPCHHILREYLAEWIAAAKLGADPVLIAYGVKRRSTSKRAHWQRIGAAYPHESGEGLTVVLDIIPLVGRIILLGLNTDDHERRAAQVARQVKPFGSGTKSR